jgi:hypothetical protein
LTLTPLRNAVIHSAWGRGKIDLPPGIAKKLRDTRVYVGADPKESRFRKDLAKSMHVERISEKDRSQKLKIKDDREQPQHDGDAARHQQNEQRKLDVEQQKAQRKTPPGQQPVKGERVGNPGQQKPRVEFKGPPVRQQNAELPQKQAAPKHENSGRGQGQPAPDGGKGKGKKP